MAAPPRITDADVAGYGGIHEAIDGLLGLVRGMTVPMEDKERAAGMLYALAIQATSDEKLEQSPPRANAETIGSKGLKILVDLMASKGASHSAQAFACAAVAIACRVNVTFAAKASKLGAVEPLVVILRSSTGAAQEHAAALVASLSSADENLDLLLKAGAVPALVRILQGGNRSKSEVHAAQALGSLASSADGQGQIHRAGGVACLLGLLGNAGTKEPAARAIARMARENAEVQKEVFKGGGIVQLLALLSFINTEVQIQAAAALSELCQGAGGKNKRKAQDAVAKAGGVGPLLAVIESPQTKQPLVAQATHALAMFARGHRANQDSIAQMGGLKTLCDQLQTSRVDGNGQNTPLSQASASLAINTICHNHLPNQTTVADLGGLAQLGMLMQRRGESNTHVMNPAMPYLSLSVEAEAAGAMWSLCDLHDANKVAAASAQVIPTLCGLLTMQLDRAQLHATKGLAALCASNTTNQYETAGLLVAALCKGDKDAEFHNRVLSVLWSMVSDNPADATAIARAGGAENLVMLLRDGTNNDKQYALWSLSLGLDETFHEVIAERDGVTPLVAALASRDAMRMEQAAAALSKLAVGGQDARLMIAKAGGIEPLVALLDGHEANGTERAQRDAAAALAELALVPSNKVSIEHAGGIAPLVALLCSHATILPEHSQLEADNLRTIAVNGKRFAAAALARLSSTDAAASAKGAAKGRPMQQPSVTDSTGSSPANPRRAPSREMGDTGLALLAGVQRQNALSKAEQIAGQGAIAPLVAMLDGVMGAQAQEEAAGALLALAEDASNRLAITEAGGIGPLVSLLGCDNRNAREHAEGALVRLSIETANRVLIIKQLVSMLVSDGSTARAAEKLQQKVSSLTKDMEKTLADKSAAEDRGATMVAKRYEEEAAQKKQAEEDAKLEAAEAARRLVEEEAAQEQAAAALANLARESTENRTSIVESGGIPALLELLRICSSQGCKENTIREPPRSHVPIPSMPPAPSHSVMRECRPLVCVCRRDRRISQSVAQESRCHLAGWRHPHPCQLHLERGQVAGDAHRVLIGC